LYVRKIRLSCERSGSSGGSSQEEQATKNALGTVTEEGEYSTEGLALIRAIRPAKAWSFSWDCLVRRRALESGRRCHKWWEEEVRGKSAEERGQERRAGKRNNQKRRKE
jgi:hypothetical protein